MSKTYVKYGEQVKIMDVEQVPLFKLYDDKVMDKDAIGIYIIHLLFFKPFFFPII